MDNTNDYIKENLKWLQVQEQQSLQIVNELKVTSKQIEYNCEQTMNQVLLFTNQLVTSINQSKKKLLSNIETLKTRLQDKVNIAKTAQQSRVDEIHKTRERLNNLLKTMRGTHEMVHEMLNKNHVLNNRYNPIDPLIQFYPNEEPMKLKYLDMGSVYIIEEADCSKCYLEKVQTAYSVLSPVHVYLRTRCSDGTPCIVPDRYLTVNILPNRYVGKIKVVESTVGKIDISFLPLITGNFVINVKIDGKEISNCPFNLQIEPKKLEIIREIEIRKSDVSTPCGIAVTPDMTKIALSDAKSHRLAVFRSDGELIRTIGQAGSKQGRLSCPDGIAFLNDYELVVADRDNHRVQIFNVISGKYVSTVGKTTGLKKQFKNPWGVSVDYDEKHIIVSDTYNHRIQIFHSKTLQRVKEYSFGQDSPSMLPSRCVSHKQLLIVADALHNKIHIIDQNEGPVQTIQTKGGRESIIKSLNGIALGSDGNLAVCDQDDGKVKLFTLEGHFIGKTDQILSPVDIVPFYDETYLIIDERSRKISIIK